MVLVGYSIGIAGWLARFAMRRDGSHRMAAILNGSGGNELKTYFAIATANLVEAKLSVFNAFVEVAIKSAPSGSSPLDDNAFSTTATSAECRSHTKTCSRELSEN